jgi:hypothetical protein
VIGESAVAGLGDAVFEMDMSAEPPASADKGKPKKRLKSTDVEIFTIPPLDSWAD